jgi:hypothetical protein
MSQRDKPRGEMEQQQADKLCMIVEVAEEVWG